MWEEAYVERWIMRWIDFMSGPACDNLPFDALNMKQLPKEVATY